MPTKKEIIRAKFRNAVFKRDNYRCKKCGKEPLVDEPLLDQLNAHHIKDRSDFSNGGYVIENGILLCLDCHFKAELLHNTGKSFRGYEPEELYRLIGSSEIKAIEADKNNENAK